MGRTLQLNKHSVAIRVQSYLKDMTFSYPMVTYSILCVFCSRLGHKIQGVLCDGDSNEVVASTVVNCLKIDEGMMHNDYTSCFRTI